MFINNIAICGEDKLNDIDTYECMYLHMFDHYNNMCRLEWDGITCAAIVMKQKYRIDFITCQIVL